MAFAALFGIPASALARCSVRQPFTVGRAFAAPSASSIPHPSLNLLLLAAGQARGMKVRSSVKKLCDGCKVGREMVIGL